MPRASGSGGGRKPPKPARVYVKPSAKGTGVRGAIDYINTSAGSRLLKQVKNPVRADITVGAGPSRKVNQAYRAAGGTKPQVTGYETQRGGKARVKVVSSVQGGIKIGAGGLYHEHKTGTPQFTGPSYIPSTTRVATHELGHALGLGHKGKTVMSPRGVAEGFNQNQIASMTPRRRKRGR